MKKRQLQNLGFEGTEVLKQALKLAEAQAARGLRGAALRAYFKELREHPTNYQDDAERGPLARLLTKEDSTSFVGEYQFRRSPSYAVWGDDIDPKAHEQIERASQLPIAAHAALMPDAHVGYGLPIGGVLATRNAVIPYAVGVDIACRVMLTVLDEPLLQFRKNRARFERVLEEQTRFGIGARFERPLDHEVLDLDWSASPITAALKDLAWKQLGTSGSGNHFVEFGEIEFANDFRSIEAGTHLALVSHSGSRGPGSKVAHHFTRVAMDAHPKLPKQYKQLAWLDMDSDGAEYWEAMQLMGHYASANHQLIHHNILRSLGAKSRLRIENHHNFAWRETHYGEECIVHRKGATPAQVGALGYIPGTMSDPGFLVEGLGEPASLTSCSHGAGRQMSRKQAKNSITEHALRKKLQANDVHVLSCGLDESPHAYKNILEVMQAQKALVKTIARFQPRLVKMAPAGEKAED